VLAINVDIYYNGFSRNEKELKMSNTFDLMETCRECGETQVINVNADDLYAWRGGKLIQNAFPYLSADERELMISGVCGKCFDSLFPPE
jgi:hypothetical protein